MRTITFEGQDQIGKASIVENLSKKLSSEGYSLYFIAYPYYSLPFGYLTSRYFKDIERFRSIDSIQNISEGSRELEIVGILFALNRLETLSTLRSLPEKDFLLSDRGPYSLAVTLAYGLQNNLVDKDDLNRVVDQFLEFDSYFRSSLETDNLVIQLRSEGEIGQVAAGERDEDDEDVYEVSEVQNLTRETYKLYAERISGWMEVTTRYDEQETSRWREREEILEEIIRIMEKKEVFDIDGAPSDVENVVRIDDLSRTQYGIDVDKANRILLNNAFDSGDKKLMGKISPDVAKRIAERTESNYFKWENGSSKSIEKMIRQYPEIEDIVSFYLGEKFSESFVRSVQD